MATTRRLEDFVPPQELFRARANYATVARNLFEVLLEAGDVREGERVLDVGCGTGRLAVPLVDHLGPAGSYEGFDNNTARIDWCNERIAPLHPNFRFRAVAVYNNRIRPDSIPAEELTFPYTDEDFDLVFLFSVFTHMLPGGVERYLSEIARVLKPGGRTVITWCLLNDESRRALAEQSGERREPATNAQEARFSHDLGVYSVADPDHPEFAVAFDEEFALKSYAKNGLEIQPPIRYGSWIGRENTLMNQDVVVAKRH
jgi:SAM-dependent methyltransferase